MNTTYWIKSLKKIFYKNPQESVSVKILRCRTMQTASSVINSLQDIPFDKLSYTLYLITNDIRMDNFIRLYESQIEMAVANPERFVSELHKFFLKMKKEIAKNPDEFLIFILTCLEAQIISPKNSAEKHVFESLLNLCIQNTCYLTTNINNQTQYFIGRSNKGNWMFVRDSMPFADISNYLDINDNAIQIMPAKVRQELKALQRQYRDFQYTPFSRHINRGYETTLMLLSPFIDDRTSEWIPKRPFNEAIIEYFPIKASISLDDLQNILLKRNKLLPNEGISFVMASPSPYPIKKISFIECLRNGNLYLLFKAESESNDMSMDMSMGEFCGFYNMKDKIEGSVFSIGKNNAAEIIRLETDLMTLILALYASYVCKGFRLAPGAFFSILPLVYKLEQRISPDPKITLSKALRRDSNKYTAEIRNVNGYIRRLPAGQTASKEALAFAEQIGLELAANETFVHSHCKTVLVLKN